MHCFVELSLFYSLGSWKLSHKISVTIIANTTRNAISYRYAATFLQYFLLQYLTPLLLQHSISVIKCRGTGKFMLSCKKEIIPMASQEDYGVIYWLKLN